MIAAAASLKELLESADTPEDLAAVEELIAELEASRPESSRWSVETLGEVAEFFGLAVQTVKQWRTETPQMPGQPGAWPLPEIVRWRLAKLAGSDLATAKKQADLELQLVAVEQKKLDLARQKAELVELSEVEVWAAAAMVETREMLMQLPQMISASAPPEIREFARAETDRHCREILAMLRRKLETDGIAEAASNPIS